MKFKRLILRLYMFKNYINKTTIIILSLLTLILGGVGYYLTSQINSTTYFNNIIEQEIVDKYTKVGFTKSDLYLKGEPELQITKFDLLKPVYTLILNSNVFEPDVIPKTESKFFTVQVFYFERTSINNFKLIDYNSNRIRDKSIQEIRELVVKQDISKNNPDKSLISNISPLTPSQIEEAEKLQTRENENDKARQEFLNGTPEFKYNTCLKERKLLESQKTALNEGKTEYEGKEIRRTVENIDRLLADQNFICQNYLK
jgi:hypothetical protein